MTLRARWISLVFGLVAAAAPPLARAGDSRGFDLTVMIDGAPAPEYAARGRIYVEALRGREFTLRLCNPTGQRVAVALSVDGRNVIDAKRTGAARAAKWVLGPYDTVEIPGWQVSGETSRRFFFTDTRGSYARWLGDTSNVGVIEAVFFRELSPPIALEKPRPLIQRRKDARDSAGAPESVEGGVEGGVPGGTPAPPPSREGAAEGQSGREERRSAEPYLDRRRSAEDFAATGIGETTSFSVRWVQFREDPTPVARVEIRYEFRPELARLGVIPRADGLDARERARGFERDYAPDPYRHR